MLMNSHQSNPPFKKRGQGGIKLWILWALGVALLLGALLFTLSGTRNLLESRARLELTAAASRKAQRLHRWQEDLTSALIILAEQKGLREGVMRLTEGKVSPEYREGFLGGADAACRMFPATHPGVQGLTLRGLAGDKWVGTGVQMDCSAVFYPEVQMRYRRVRLATEPGRVLEHWIVPVRDVQAQPLAFLVAEVDPALSRRIFPELDTFGTDLVCLDDSSGARLWEGSNKLRLPRLSAPTTEFILEGKEYLLARALVSGSGWSVCQARDRGAITSGLNHLLGQSAIFAACAVVLLGLVAFIMRDKG
jgi:hypothetical protein